jgi:hypothetical protein|tara:strand:- start:46 stop:576 length:531 start_codon:yes stop_codon:yes gene_type:complete
MARQSATNPRFRCNVCKDYYSAPKHNVHYQCASHGYLCKKHIAKSGSKVGVFVAYQSNVNTSKPIEKVHYGKCKLGKKGTDLERYGEISVSDSLSNYKGYKNQMCLKKPVKYNWHKDIGRWIEEGREEEEKAKAKPKAKSKTKPDYAKEIKVLVDLLEDDTLTKEVFIKKIREKLK